jgi:cytochrome P450
LLRDSDLPPQEKAPDRLWETATVFNVAGSETTARALALIVFYLLESTEDLNRLQEELKKAFPDGWNIDIPTIELEKLPFMVSSIVFC